MKKFIIPFGVLIVLVCFILILKNNNIPQIIDKVTMPEKEAEFTLISTGDIGLVRDINNRIIQKKDPNYPFLRIASYLRDADLTITNLEGPLIKNCPVILDGFTFCGNLENVNGLTYAGIDAANLANNHTTNYGIDGLSQTANILSKNNIKPFGLEDQIEYLDINGLRVALVGFVELGNNWSGLNNATVENVEKLNKTASENADVVINAYHWGVEYTTHSTENQKLLAHTSIDSGADIVLGNHPHWIQDYEAYKGRPIIYAQGNTVFDQDWSEETKEGVLYKFVFRNGKFEKIDEKFTIIEDNSQPRFAKQEEIEKIKSRLVN